MSGGANKGAYQVGVIDSFVKKLAPEDITYDVVTGVSAGALNAFAASLFEPGDEKNMIDFMINEIWS